MVLEFCSSYLLDDVALDLVAVLDVVEVLKSDAALEALAHLGDVVLEAAKASDVALPRDDAVAYESRARVASDHAVGHAAARDGPGLRHADRWQHERLAENLLLLDLVEHAYHRRAYLLLDLVDDRVEAYVDVLLPRKLRRARLGADVEADDDDRPSGSLGLRSRGEQNVRLRYRADA